MAFPNYTNFPVHVRELFEYYEGMVRKGDLESFAKGTYFEDNIINVYMKILSKMNQVLIASSNYQKDNL